MVVPNVFSITLILAAEIENNFSMNIVFISCQLVALWNPDIAKEVSLSAVGGFFNATIKSSKMSASQKGAVKIIANLFFCSFASITLYVRAKSAK